MVKLDNAAIIVESHIKVAKPRQKICFTLPFNGSNIFLYANGVKVYQFKAKGFEAKA